MREYQESVSKYTEAFKECEKDFEEYAKDSRLVDEGRMDVNDFECKWCNHVFLVFKE